LTTDGLEIVLGIDNAIFLSVIVSEFRSAGRKRAANRLALALVFRILLLAFWCG